MLYGVWSRATALCCTPTRKSLVGEVFRRLPSLEELCFFPTVQNHHISEIVVLAVFLRVLSFRASLQGWHIAFTPLQPNRVGPVILALLRSLRSVLETLRASISLRRLPLLSLWSDPLWHRCHFIEFHLTTDFFQCMEAHCAPRTSQQLALRDPAGLPCCSSEHLHPVGSP